MAGSARVHIACRNVLVSKDLMSSSLYAHTKNCNQVLTWNLRHPAAEARLWVCVLPRQAPQHALPALLPRVAAKNGGHGGGSRKASGCTARLLHFRVQPKVLQGGFYLRERVKHKV